MRPRLPLLCCLYWLIPACLCQWSSEWEGIPRCGNGGILPRDGLCEEWLDAYAPIMDTMEITVDVDCSTPEDEGQLDELKDCRHELTLGDFWSGVGWFHQVNFRDSYGPLQGTEWNVRSPLGWMDLEWSSKLDGSGKRCQEGDGYCRKRRICTVTGMVSGLVTETGGEDKVHSWEYSWERKDWWNPRVKGSGLYRREVKGCVACQVVPCTGYGCPNGRVVGRPADSVGGVVVKRPACGKECSPGTFLTCRTGERCEYLPLTDAQTSADGSGYRRWYEDNLRINSDLNIVPVGQLRPPVEDCYPCKFADRRTHAGVAQLTDGVQAGKGFLGFFCPGGASLPEDCPLNMVTRVDPATNRTSGCGCKAGMVYEAASKSCVPCKAGHYCAWDGMAGPVERECPLDFYSEGGAEACKKCDTKRSCDAGRALTRCMPARAGGMSGQYQRRDSECVSCSECQQLSSDASAVPCYKVSPIVGFG